MNGLSPFATPTSIWLLSTIARSTRIIDANEPGEIEIGET